MAGDTAQDQGLVEDAIQLYGLAGAFAAVIQLINVKLMQARNCATCTVECIEQNLHS